VHLLLTNCNTTEAMTEDMAAAARTAATPGTEITALTPAWGPESCEGWLDSFISAAAVLDALTTAPEAVGPFDAVVMSGFGEHGRQAARELLDVPVVDITEAAAHLALLIGERFAVVTSLSRTAPLIEESLRGSGLLERCHAIDAVDLPVLALDADPDRTAAAFAGPARAAVAAGADVIVLGCAGMAGLRERLEADCGVPVVDGVGAAVVLAEGLVRLGLVTGRAHGYAHPLPKVRRGWPVSAALGRSAVVHRPPAYRS
jgi:allantoin racemase